MPLDAPFDTSALRPKGIPPFTAVPEPWTGLNRALASSRNDTFTSSRWQSRNTAMKKGLNHGLVPLALWGALDMTLLPPHGGSLGTPQ